MANYDKDQERGQEGSRDYQRDAAPWSEYRRLVFKMLEDLASDIGKLETELKNDLKEVVQKMQTMDINHNSLATKVGEQRLKLSLWHVLAASLPALLSVIAYLVFKK